MTMPDDHDDGVEGLLKAAKEGTLPFPNMVPLQQRGQTAVKVSGGEGDLESRLYREFGFSRHIAQLSKMTEKQYGFLRDGNAKEHLERVAIKGALRLHAFFFNAPCFNRQGRFDAEEDLATTWQDRAQSTPLPDGAPDLDALLYSWNHANAWMLHARIYQDKHGIDAARHLYQKYADMEKQREGAEQDAAELPPAHNQLFWCRVRQYRIMAESTYDAAMDIPQADYTHVKRLLADGANIHDVVHLMTWPFQEAYRYLETTLVDGENHRQMMMALTAQQLPAQQPAYGMMPPWGWNGNGQGQPDQNGEGEQDRRPALFGLFGGKKQPDANGGQPQQKPLRRRKNRGRG